MFRTNALRAIAATLFLAGATGCGGGATGPDVADDARIDIPITPDVQPAIDAVDVMDAVAPGDAADARPDAFVGPDTMDAARDAPGDVARDAPEDVARDVPADCSSTQPDGACGPCPAGYENVSGRCTDVDECTTGTSDCDTGPGGRCANTPGGFTCACAPGWSGTGTGPGSCRWNDPSLLALVPSAGTLSPVFAAGTTMYSLSASAPSLTLTATVAQPTRTTIRVNGAPVDSGSASPDIAVGVVPAPVSVTVTTESGATRTYTIVLSLRSVYAKASNTRSDAYFGTSIALSADGATLAVGSPLETSGSVGVGGSEASRGYDYAGAVYVFTRSAGGAWTQQAYVKASNTGIGQYFGQSVALSADGATLAVGANGERSNATGVDGEQRNTSALNAGAVYVFARSGSAWSQQAYVKASNTGAGDSFGYAVALSADGATLAVGAHNEDSSAPGVGGNEADNAATDSGAAYVFTRSGATWSQQAYLKASNPGAGDYFGLHLALSADGATLAVAAEREDSAAAGVGGDPLDESASGAGAVYVFARSGSAWSQQAYVKASNPGASDSFGTAVALSGDGSVLAVGAALEDSNATGIGGNQADNSAADAGAVYLFARAAGAWTQQAYVKASNAGAGDSFGTSLALSADGATLVVGARGERSNATGINGDQANDAAAAAGAAYLFAVSGGAWAQRVYLKASNTGTGDAFGAAVALSADGASVAVGAEGEDSNATGIGGNQASNAAVDSGAAYVF